MSQFKTFYEKLPPPLPAAIEIIGHILVSPSTLFDAPLSRPVIERLQWIKPSLEDEHESYLYFNNMDGHGASGRIHDLRMDLIHTGPSSWHFCPPEEAQYKVDENCIDTDGLCEILCRVKLWKARKEGETVAAKEQLALILKLEADLARDQPLNLQADDQAALAGKVSWKYFDLQDIVTPGIDRRRWLDSLSQVALAQTSRPSERNGSRGESSDYWAGYSSGSTEGSTQASSTSGSDNRRDDRRDTIPIDPALVARIQNTPLYRSKAPSVSSTANSDERAPAVEASRTPALGKGPVDLRSRISRTPLYKRAPSVDASPPEFPKSNASKTDIDLHKLLDAARIVNLPPNPSTLDSSQNPQTTLHPVETSSHPHPQPHSLSSSSTQKEIHDKLVDSLRATFHLYRLCHENSNPSSASDSSRLTTGESFIALAHRVVLQESSIHRH